MSEPMRVLTVRQPWAWAIFHGKTVENRSKNVFGAYRGPVAVHAGQGYDADAWDDIYLIDRDTYHAGHSTDNSVMPGVILGVVELVDVHHGMSEDCDCRYDSDNWPDIERWHGVLKNPRELATPIPYKGALGLRRLPADVEAQVLAGLS